MWNFSYIYVGQSLTVFKEYSKETEKQAQRYGDRESGNDSGVRMGCMQEATRD